MGAVAKFYSEGGAWMHPILAMSIIGLGVIIERFIFLYFKYNINAAAFMAQIQKLVMANNIDRAIKLCNAAPSAALPKVVKAGLTRANKGPEEIQNAVEEATLEIVPVVTKRTTVLAQIANIATLLGLLGTILGLITAFEALGNENVPPDERTKLLARGISMAMNTTAFGLIVAIPCLGAQVFLASVTKKIIDEIDHYSVKLENLLISRLHGGSGENR
ncbi:MAG: MotA/TolQ/ExbB proton channel family protein [Myxococcales bacterium]|nr:MotA/TolQ/ExbB proton channel family protein [Myxococcales bacterium]